MNRKRVAVFQIVSEDVLDSNLLACAIHFAKETTETSNCVAKKRKIKKVRARKYFEITIPLYCDDQFAEHFRMRRGTFEVMK